MPKKHAPPPSSDEPVQNPDAETALPASGEIPLPFDVDELDDLMADDDLIVEEPDPQVLVAEAEEVEVLEREEPLELLKRTGIVTELSEDPVRLYLKEIGEINLLDSDHEFWLATRMESAHQIDALSRTHPIIRRNESNVRAVYQALYEEVKTDKARIAQLEAELARQKR